MDEKCTLNFVPVTKMALMLDKCVNSNESHALETFFDHDVFRRSYQEVKKSVTPNLIQDTLGNQNYFEI